MANPNIPVLLELRSELEDEMAELRKRIKRIQNFIQALDASITTGSFATADTALGASPTIETPAPSTEPPEVPELRSVVLYNKGRELELGTIEITENEIRVIPASHAIYDIKRGAFARFFVGNILGKFQEEDRHKVEEGNATWEEAFDFEVRAEDGILEEVIIRNYGTEERLNEIERALRWTFEKIYRVR